MKNGKDSNTWKILVHHLFLWRDLAKYKGYDFSTVQKLRKFEILDNIVNALMSMKKNHIFTKTTQSNLITLLQFEESVV